MLPDRRTWRVAAGVVAGVAIAAIALAIVIYVSASRDIAFGIFTGESSRAVVDDWYAGLLSDLGLAIWAFGAVGSLLAALLHLRRGRPGAGFFAAMGVITAWLAADDAFLWHEELIPDTVGVDEKVVFVVYGVVTVAAMVAGRSTIVRNLWWVLGTACVLLAGSIVAERVGFSLWTTDDVVSVFKFMGIVTWTAFLVEAAVHQGIGSATGSSVVQNMSG
ncbi:MAG: hypothetical protein ABJH68_01675 [Ilumatobacter sp.]|uniref:hypothetical protein n=1 Tax=Ilumatobacter sp. TaxID=1967498 RepID=UPI0032968B1F